jgi:ergothioneine biosynthesis protein EgtB
LSRPSFEEVMQYRRHVDEHMQAFLGTDDAACVRDLIELGLHHEQQHQELILTDVKHLFWCNPLRPAYREPDQADDGVAPALQWHEYPAGLHYLGHDGNGFHFDNEAPRHRIYAEAFALGSRPVTCGEYLDFIADRGYTRPDLWLSDGWDAVCANGWRAPLYWEESNGDWWHFTLGGMRRVDPAEPVTHVSYYEADAYARWADARLPGEAEWEAAARCASIEGNFLEGGRLHPSPTRDIADGMQQIYGDVWEWTQSAYAPYPGFRPAAGAVGEYNGKFMVNQLVLRGGSCATPQSHIRPSYRNFFPPAARWQFSGIRLARDVR